LILFLNQEKRQNSRTYHEHNASDDSNNNVQIRVRKLLIGPTYLRVRNSDGTSSRDLWSYYRNRNLLNLW